jgi:4-hydroxybenzoate polyprenyltransferase
MAYGQHVRELRPLRHPGTATTGRPARAWAVVRVTRPWFWPLGWAGAYVGAVLATRTWLPPAHAVPESLAALVILGPLVWGAVLTVNDVHDLPSDRHNPRKAAAPLVTGVLAEADLARWHRRCVVAAMVAAAAVGPAFAIGTGAVLLLGWLYSAPPFRLKARPGADVAVNAAVIGVLGPLAGWCLHRPIGDFPPVMVVLGLLLAAALYLPTTVMDVDADRVAGDATAAVRWEPRLCYRLGVALWAAAIAVWLICCHLDVLVPRQTWWVQTVLAPVLLVAYAVLARQPSIFRMAAVSVAFALPAADFLTACVAAGPLR